jgi:hypothetical protein
MSLQERLIQCRADKVALAANEQELLDQIKESEKPKIPFARFVTRKDFGFGNGGPRLILNLTPEFVHLVREHQGHVISLGAYGGGGIEKCCVTTNEYPPRADSLVGQYKDVQTLIE